VAAMQPSVTAILAGSLGSAFAVAVVSILVAAKRQKAATDKDLYNGPFKRSDGDGAGTMAPLFLVTGQESVHPDGTSDGSPPDSDSSAAEAGSDGGGGGGE
jgi:hypothetical protein